MKKQTIKPKWCHNKQEFLIHFTKHFSISALLFLAVDTHHWCLCCLARDMKAQLRNYLWVAPLLIRRQANDYQPYVLCMNATQKGRGKKYYDTSWQEARHALRHSAQLSDPQITACKGCQVAHRVKWPSNDEMTSYTTTSKQVKLCLPSAASRGKCCG